MIEKCPTLTNLALELTALLSNVPSLSDLIWSNFIDVVLHGDVIIDR
jgi:hypothetical protein